MTDVSSEIFRAWRAPRFGATNPERLDNPLWASLVHDRIDAYQVARRYGHARARGEPPTWCFDRFGRTTTELPDGRTLCIGGEHEDYYDPDFYIYNDVVEVSPGGAVAIYGYPREVFPPTDFHTATRHGGAIWLVGSLGYAGERAHGTTQVCRLDLATMAIARVATTGDGPGWLHGHTAEWTDGAIVVRGGKVEVAESDHLEENIDEWALDLATLAWTRRTRREWQRWSVEAPSGARSWLWELRQLQWHVEHPTFRGTVDYAAQITAATGHPPALEALQTLYAFDGAAACEPGEDEDYNRFRISLDGVIVQFVEESRRVAVLVEGQLAEPRLRALQQHVLDRVSAAHAVAWALVRP